MNAQTGWMVFLAIINNLCCGLAYFTLEDKPLSATEGSCVEIKCRVTARVNAANGAFWFWIKDSVWNGNGLTGTNIYSSSTEQHPVSQDFAERVKYIGSPPLNWNNVASSPKRLCSILICDLKKTDAGSYGFRFEGETKWFTKPQVILEVKENLCPITFEKPPVIKDNGTITLTCSTSPSCRSELEIQGLPFPVTSQQQRTKSDSFTVNWEDNGRVYSCQTKNNNDPYLIRNITVTVEYAPKGTKAEISPKNIVERQSVTLTCSAKANPDPTFTWFKNKDIQRGTGAVWKIASIEEFQSGEYHCEAKNHYGSNTSNPVIINVTYVPEVEVMSPDSVVQQGDKMTLTCNVKRSNPQPDDWLYDWYKNEKAIVSIKTHQYVVGRVEPEDGGGYTCAATNAVGTGKSRPLTIEIEYGPRKTNISISKDDKTQKTQAPVDVGNSLTFYCITDANPPPERYSWYRYNSLKEIDSSRWKSRTTNANELHLKNVQRADEACYRCNATNSINTGEDSDRLCIRVLYPPTEPVLSMDAEVREGQIITITCTVESYPTSELTLTRTSESNSQSSDWRFPLLNNYNSNTLQHTFNVTLTHAGFYACGATNSKGSNTSRQRKLVVKYRPKDVMVQAEPDLVVYENKSLILHCSAQAHPPVASVTWMKVTDGGSETIWKTPILTLKSVGPSDRGLYSCTASNDIGSGNSQQAEVKVMYAPKYTKITRAAEHQLPDGTSYVKVSCSSDSNPPVTQYSWYKMKAEEQDEKLHDQEHYTVYSNQPGVYYCIAKNEISQSRSDPVHLFDQGLMKMRWVIIFLLITILLILFFVVFVYRTMRKKSSQQGTTNTQPCFGFLGWRNRMNHPGIAGPFRSRDDLLTDQPHRPNAQRCQPRPDSTPASNINSVYCTANLPSRNQGTNAQKPMGQQGGHTQDDSVNYASLHFGNEQKNKGANAEVDVYAKVSKPPKKNEDKLEDYENISPAHTGRSPDPLDYDTDTSEEEVEINYSQVTFKATPGHQRASRDSSSSDEETQYSDVKI